MKPVYFSIVAVLASLVSAQNGLPSCAQDCVTQYTTGSQIGSCQQLNVQCICSDQNFLSGIACCLAGACDAADQATAVTYAQNLCKTAGVAVPDAVSCVSSSSTATATSAVDAASSSASSAASSVSSSVSSATSSASSSATSAAATPNAGSVAGVGAGLFGGLAAAVVLL